jgi:hypothetical protein
MKEFSATTTIAASPETIWSILTDAPRYPEWEPTVDRIEGTIAHGNKITAYTKLSPGRAFPVTVSTFEPGQKMVWSGGMPLGLFKGERTFTLTPQGNGTVQVMVKEVFSGPLLPLIGRTLPDLNQAFAQFVDGLKQRAEGMA